MRSSLRTPGILVPRNGRHFRQLQTACSSPNHREGAVFDLGILDNYHALVLDCTFRPLAIINWHRALTMDIFRSVEVLEYYDCFVQTVREVYPIPAVLRSDFIHKTISSVKVPVSRKNVLRRDNHSCVYCGTTKDLTIDHVVPLSKGGAHDWGNVVTACKSCNHRKGNRSLEQLGWTLKKKPKRPGNYEIRKSINWLGTQPEEWRDYIAHLKDFEVF